MIRGVAYRFQRYQNIYKFGSSRTPIHQNQQSQEEYLNQVRQRYVTPDAENWTYLDYKNHPQTVLPHYNPKSKEYIPSERDDYNAQIATEAHNETVDSFKRSLEMQRKVHDILRRMDRPYLNGLPGVHRNISAGLQNYGGETATNCQGNRLDFYEDAYKNENRWIDQAVYHPKFFKMTHYDVEWPKELANRPVNPDYHPDKGYKYDVDTPYDERYDFQADRLGHPEMLGNPVERLFRLEVIAGTAAYATHIALHYMNNIARDYVVRAQYSKDKELLFVTRISTFGSTEEEVYETAHLEHLPPSVKAGVKHMSCQDSDGLLDVTCMNSQKQLVFYLGEQYWNPKIRNNFLNQTNNMWSRDYTGLNRVEQLEQEVRNQITFGENKAQHLLEKQ